MERKEVVVDDGKEVVSKENLPKNHFTETDVVNIWKSFLEKIKEKDIVLYNAINGFKIHKYDEDSIIIHYPSESAKTEFEKVNVDFFNILKHQLNHHQLTFTYKMDSTNLKKEIINKRTVFEKFAQINPLLRELDDLCKFDLD